MVLEINMQEYNARPELSVVVPVFNEAGNLEELWKRLRATMDRLALKDFEVIFVDDGSSDESAAIIERMHRDDNRIKLVGLSRNFGHNSALAAGLEYARGNGVVFMDADLQDQPEAIGRLYEAWKQGAEVCYAIRTSRQENAALRFLFKAFYKLMAFVAGVQMPKDAGVFCLMDRRVVDVLRTMPEHHRYFPGLRAFVGFRQVGIPVERAARHAGRSRVGITGQLRLALDAIFSFSYLPLRLATWLGLLTAGAAFCVLLNVLYKKWVSHEAILGWASTMTAVLFIGGIQLITLGILGEYVGRIYEEAKKRPLFLVRRTLGLSPRSDVEQVGR